MTHDELMKAVSEMTSRLTKAVEASEFGGRLLMAQLTGSHAYGLSTPQSDVDLRGMHLGRTLPVDGVHPLLGIHPAYTPSSPNAELRIPDEDSASLELGKVCHLCLQGNPSALELLFVPKHHLLVTSPEYEGLVDLRHRFLSQKVPAAYLGYTWSNLSETSNHLVRAMVKRDASFHLRLVNDQNELEGWIRTTSAREKLHKLATLGVDWPDASESRALKAASHVIRLLMALEHLLTDGELLVDLGDRAEEVRRVRRGEVSMMDFYQDVIDRRDRVEAMAKDADLPPSPDVTSVNRFVSDVRLRDLFEHLKLGIWDRLLY